MSEIVSCYSGGRYAERPQRLMWEGGWLGISKILSSWRSPQGPCFRVLTEDKRRFELMFDEAMDDWQIKAL